MGLLAAAESGDIKKVEQLLDADGTNASKVDYRERTALHLAVERGHLELAEVLIDREDADYYCEDGAGYTPLHLAVELGHDKLVARMLEKRPRLASKRSKRTGLTCLHLAVARGHIAMVRRLLATNLKLVNVEDKNENLALCHALENEHEEIATILAESVKSNLAYAQEMLRCAIRGGSDRIAIQLLVQSPDLIDGIVDHGKSVLHLAAQCRRDAVMAHVFALRPDLTEVGGIYKMSLLHLAAEYGCETLLARLLVERPHLIDVVGENGESVLHLAAKNEHGADMVVSQLLAVQASLAMQRDFEGQTALHYAAKHGNYEAVARLLAHSPELIDVKNGKGETALCLSLAARLRLPSDRDTKTLQCLLAHRPAHIDANILWLVLRSARDDDVAQMLLAYRPKLIESPKFAENGETILHYAFRHGGSRFLEELMRTVYQRGPSKKALRKRNRDNQTPFHVAIRADNQVAVELVHGKFSLDQIMETFAKCNKECFPLSFLDQLRGCLLEVLGKDVAGTVREYLGLGEDKPPNNSNKRKRVEHEASDESSDDDNNDDLSSF